MKVTQRPVKLSELGDFAECGLCGTAAVISPVGKVVDHGKEICFPSGMEKMGPVTQKLYDTLTGIQMGKIEARLDPQDQIRKSGKRHLILNQKLVTHGSRWTKTDPVFNITYLQRWFRSLRCACSRYLLCITAESR